MLITFVCQSCEDTFELDYAQLTEENKGVRCSNCKKRLAAADVDELITSLDELLGQVAALRKRFALSFEIDAEDLPPPFDSERRRGGRSVESDDDDEDDDSEDEGEELEEDEDEDERY